MEALEDRTYLSISWYVSPTGSDTLNTGQSLGAPFQTIQKAAASATAGDTVFIRAGTYRETVTPTNSGTSGAPITYMPYNGEKVMIDGADIVTNWTLYNGGASGPIYQAPMNWSVNPYGNGAGDGNQVFVDGQMMNYARWPNTSLDVSRPTKATATTGSYQLVGSTYYGTYTAPGLSAFAANSLVGAMVHFLPSATKFFQQTGTVTANDPTAGTVTFRFDYLGASYYAPSNSDSFFINGTFQAMDAPGEWYLNSGTQMLYLQTPARDTPANHVVEAKARQYAFNLNGRSYTNLQGLSIFAASITTDATSTHDTINGIQALYISHCEQATATYWQRAEDTGIIIRGSNNILENSEIGFSAGNGVLLEGNNTSWSTGNVVTNNVIHDMDYMALWCAGVGTGNGGGNPAVYSATSTFNTISNNTIYNTGRDVINFGNFGSGFIINNDLYSGMLQTADGGALYTYEQNGKAFNSGNPSTVIAYNRVHDLLDKTDVGIYLDNGSTNYVVHHNLVYDAYYAMTLNLPSNNNLIYNNTLAGSSQSITAWGTTTDMTGTYIENNICTNPVNLGTNYAAYAYNLPSTTAPGFVDPNALNFQLQANSAAMDRGTVIPGYTDGYVGVAPDIGAFEYGLPTSWTAGASAATNTFIGAVPATPTGLATTSPDPTQINLTWQNNASNETGYVVERSTDGRSFTSIVRLPAQTTFYADNSLVAGVYLYYYRVRADNGIYNSSYSNTATAIPLPAAPTGLATTATAPTFLYDFNSLTPGTLTGQDGWYKQRSYALDAPVALGTSPAGSSNMVQSINNVVGARALPTGTFFMGTETAAVFQYDVVATRYFSANQIWLGGNGNNGNLTDDWAGAQAQLGPRLGFYNSASPSFYNFVLGVKNPTGGWTDMPALSSVPLGDWITLRLVMNFSANGGDGAGSVYYKDLTLGNTSFSAVSGLQNINLGLIAGLAAGCTPDKWNQVGFDLRPVDTYTSSIDNLYVTSAISDPTTQINLSWTAPSGTFSGYNIYRGTTSGGESLTPLNGSRLITKTVYIDTTANPGTTYYYTVKAVNSSGSSVASNEANALTYPAAPTGLSATPGWTNQVNLGWTAPGGMVSGCNVYRGTTPGGENYAAPLNGGMLVTATTYSDTTASPGTTYYYTVKAVNASGSSVTSNEAHATTLTATALPTALKAYWRLDEGTGATANDTATGGTVADIGTLYGTPTWVVGKVGNALQLNGASQYLQAADSADVNISGAALTVALWAKSGTTNWNSTETFLSKGSGIKFGGVSGTKNLEVSLYISGACG